MRYILVLLIFGLVWQNILAMKIQHDSYDTDESIISFRLKKVENLLTYFYEKLFTKEVVREPQTWSHLTPSIEFEEGENGFKKEVNLAVAEPSQGTTTIPNGTNTYYIESSEELSWSGAIISCKKMGGVLFSPRSLKVWETVRMNLDRNKNYWTSIRVHPTYVSADSTEHEVPFLEFDPNSQRQITCIELDSQSSHLMNEVDCNNKNNYICEMYNV